MESEEASSLRAAVPMKTGELINIQPSELHFPFELKKQVTSSFRISNKTGNYVAFKVCTTNPNNYCVRPNKGVLLPLSSCDLMVILRAQKEVPVGMQCKDKFLVQSVVTTTAESSDSVTRAMFEKEEGRVVEEYKMKAVYTYLDQAQSPTAKLLNIQPSELSFPCKVPEDDELKKQISSTLKLSNKTGNHVAFKINTTNPKNYAVRPNKGIISPSSSCNIMVKMQAQKEFPVGMQCKDKFLVQSAVTTAAASSDNIKRATFEKGEGRVVEEVKMNVVYKYLDQEQSPTAKMETGDQPPKLYSPYDLKQQKSSFQPSGNTKYHVVFKFNKESGRYVKEHEFDMMYDSPDQQPQNSKWKWSGLFRQLLLNPRKPKAPSSMATAKTATASTLLSRLLRRKPFSARVFCTTTTTGSGINKSTEGGGAYESTIMVKGPPSTFKMENPFQSGGAGNVIEVDAVKEGTLVRVTMPGVGEGGYRVWVEENTVFFAGKGEIEHEEEKCGRTYGGSLEFSPEVHRAEGVKDEMKHDILRLIVPDAEVKK